MSKKRVDSNFIFFLLKGAEGKGKNDVFFRTYFFYHMSLAYTGNISNLKKKTFQPNGKSWMAFFVENLKYRERKKKLPRRRYRNRDGKNGEKIQNWDKKKQE